MACQLHRNYKHVLASMHAVGRGTEACFQQVSQLPKVLKTVFKDTCQLCSPTMYIYIYIYYTSIYIYIYIYMCVCVFELCFTMVAWQSEVCL